MSPNPREETHARTGMKIYDNFYKINIEIPMGLIKILIYVAILVGFIIFFAVLINFAVRFF